nr:uncharacterized mitochondrial protein AtMg00810-like [Tanacetum cinerariifolium]
MTIHMLLVRRESNIKPLVRPRLFSWVFFLATKDETPKILKNFIVGIENQIDHKVKSIRCDNGTEFKNMIMNEFYEMKGIRREFSVAKTPQQNGLNSSEDEVADDAGKKREAANTNSTNILNIVSSPVNASSSFTTVDPGREIAQRNKFESIFGQDKDVNGNRMLTLISAARSTYVNLGGSILVNATTLPNADLPIDPLMPNLEDTTDLQDTGIFNGAYDNEVKGAVADFNSLELTTIVSPIPTTRIQKDHLKEQIIGDLLSAPQTRRMTKTSQEHALVSYIKKQRRTNHKDYHDCLFSCFLLQIEPKKVIQALTDPSWIEEMQDELLQFRLQKVYVDDIIFGSTKKSLCTVFEGLVHKKFQMSSMGELIFFLVLQVMQQDDGIFISQDKYVADILKKFNFSSVKTSSTLMVTNKALLKDEEAEEVDVHLYISMIGSLMYPTTSRPDIMFVVCTCVRFQVTPKVSHLHAMKRIFRYLKGQPKLGLWYLRDSPFDLEAFLDSDYIGALVASSTTKAEYVAVANCRRQIYTYYCQLKVSAAKSKFTTAGDGYCCRLFKEPTESEGFEKIIDFLNVSYVKYALTVNPTVYTSCIEQFWATAKVKNVIGDAQLQALVDKKKVIVTKASIRRDLRFEDEGGVDCLSNEVIFEQLTLMGSTMASAIICLAINQKFNFSKYIFDNMVKHLDGGVKFLMYLRFVQVFLDNKVEGMDRHNAIFVISSYTKKVFANMKREGKDFFRKVTPLFKTTMVQAPEDMGEEEAKIKDETKEKIEVPSPSSEIPNEEGVPITSNDPLPSGEDRMQLNELMILCINLQKQVLDLKEAKTAQAKEIASLKKRVKKLEHKRKSRTLGLKRLRKVRSASKIESSTEASLGNQEDASKQGRMVDNIDQDVEITLVDDTHGRMNEEDMFGVNDIDGDDVVVDVSTSEKVEYSVKVVEKEVSTADPITTVGEVIITAGIEVTTVVTTPQISKDKLTLAQTLIDIKAAKPKTITTAATIVTAAGTRPKEKGIVMQEPSETPSLKPIISSQNPSQAKDKGKGKMVEPERPLKRKDQIMMDAKVAKNLEAQMQAKLEEEERLARLKEEETNLALIEL